MDRSSVFLDTSVLVAALLSDTGGSSYLLTVLKDKFTFHTNGYVLAELEHVLDSKFARQAVLYTKLFLILGVAKVVVWPYPPKPSLIPLKKIISEKDAPILAGALAGSDYLLTLDNEFFNDRVVTYARQRKLEIVKPKDLI
ncbi:MAG: putative toxin-antitoxin system toxin component, PIN family [Candidatus Vogelbacteria bacterium]|nr:putative toxin-antitoxin system toxin component, PIN family [Candidatus Vogelbacteria bacterium]